MSEEGDFFTKLIVVLVVGHGRFIRGINHFVQYGTLNRRRKHDNQGQVPVRTFNEGS